MGSEEALMAAHRKLVELEERVAAQRAYRNHELRAALGSGVTWKRAQEITGLTPRGVQLSIRGGHDVVS